MYKTFTKIIRAPISLSTNFRLYIILISASEHILNVIKEKNAIYKKNIAMVQAKH